MRILRSVLAFCLVFSLVATPVAARVAGTTTATPHAGMVKTSQTPDCHGMKMLAGGHNQCPYCDKGSPCTGDACQFKCFKVVADLPRIIRADSVPSEQFLAFDSGVPAPISWTPQPPPPRA